MADDGSVEIVGVITTELDLVDESMGVGDECWIVGAVMFEFKNADFDKREDEVTAEGEDVNAVDDG